MKKTVCIIDDDEDFRDTLASALVDDGFEVIHFENPEEAMADFDFYGELPGFILLNKIGVIKKIRNDYHIPCAFSSYGNDASEGLPSDVMELRKPMDLDYFLDLVRDNCL